jgi:hypothetical protein
MTLEIHTLPAFHLVVAQPIEIGNESQNARPICLANDRADRAATDQPISFAGLFGDGPVCISQCILDRFHQRFWWPLGE